MKNSLQYNPPFIRMLLLVACFMLVIVFNKSKAADLPTAFHANNKATVNFKTNTERNELNISLKTGRVAIMQLFIFSPDGILIKEVAVSAHKITTIKGLGKGLYFYECFDNNERMNSGSLMVQ